MPELVETLGIERSYQAMADADLTLVVADLSRLHREVISVIDSNRSGFAAGHHRHIAGKRFSGPAHRAARSVAGDWSFVHHEATPTAAVRRDLWRISNTAAAPQRPGMANARNVRATVKFQPSRIPPASGPTTAPSRPSAMAHPTPVDRTATGYISAARAITPACAAPAKKPLSVANTAITAKVEVA